MLDNILLKIYNLSKINDRMEVMIRKLLRIKKIIKSFIISNKIAGIAILSFIIAVIIAIIISYDITEQLLAMIRPECEDVNALIFIEKWLTLSVSGREQMAGDIRYLYEQEKKYNKFPWKYVDSIFERK